MSVLEKPRISDGLRSVFIDCLDNTYRQGSDFPSFLENFFAVAGLSQTYFAELVGIEKASIACGLQDIEPRKRTHKIASAFRLSEEYVEMLKDVVYRQPGKLQKEALSLLHTSEPKREKKLLERFEINSFGDFVRVWHQLSGSNKSLDPTPISFFVDSALDEHISYREFSHSFRGEKKPSPRLIDAVRKVFPINKSQDKIFFSHQLLYELEGLALSNVESLSKHVTFEEILTAYINDGGNDFKEFLSLLKENWEMKTPQLAQALGINTTTLFSWFNAVEAPSISILKTTTQTLSLSPVTAERFIDLGLGKLGKLSFSECLNDYIDAGGTSFLGFLNGFLQQAKMFKNEFAAYVGMHENTVINWFKGELPRKESIIKVAEAYSLNESDKNKLNNLIFPQQEYTPFDILLRKYQKTGGTSFKGLLGYVRDEWKVTNTQMAGILGLAKDSVIAWIEDRKSPLKGHISEKIGANTHLRRNEIILLATFMENDMEAKRSASTTQKAEQNPDDYISR